MSLRGRRSDETSKADLFVVFATKRNRLSQCSLGRKKRRWWSFARRTNQQRLTRQPLASMLVAARCAFG